MLTKVFRYTLYLLIAFVVFLFIYFNLYYKYIYLTDDKIKAYLVQHQADFDQLIAAKVANCGKYFEKLEHSKYDLETKEDYKVYGYIDRFFEKSPEAKLFKQKHNEFLGDSIRGLVADKTWNMENFKDFEKRWSQTFDEAVTHCQTNVAVTFAPRKQTSFAKLTGFKLEGPYFSEKYFAYLTNPDNEHVHDWQAYQQNRGLYNKAFDEGSDALDISYAEYKQFIKNPIYRASDVSSDYFLDECHKTTHNGFTQIQPNWYVFTWAGSHRTYCEPSYGSLPIMFIFQSFID